MSTTLPKARVPKATKQVKPHTMKITHHVKHNGLSNRTPKVKHKAY